MSRKIDRRQALGAIGTVSFGGLIAACGGETAAVEPKSTTSDATGAPFEDSASCALTVEQTEGPFYFDADKVRSDIREDREGVRLRLALRVRDAGTCKPLPDAVIDVWHADAGGEYSGFDDAPTKTRYLRGAQVTNKQGVAEFTTIYPGWYPGRAPHIHAMVHLNNSAVLTSQLYFDDDVSSKVYERAEYSERGERDQLNEGDGIFDDSLVMTTKRDGDGYLAVMSIDVRSA